MTTDSRNADLTARAIAASDHLGEALAELTAIAAAIHDSLSTPVKAPFEPPSNPLQTRVEIFAAHRRAHRSGRLGKIEGNPELEAFILKRIGLHTYAEIIGEVKTHFSPDRQTSASAVQRWWRNRHDGAKAQ